MKALVVEPSKPIRSLLVSALENMGIDCVEALTGYNGAQQHLIDEFAFTIVALHLEDMNGEEFCNQLRKQEDNQNHPVLMVTSDNRVEFHNEMRRKGLSEVFHKSDLKELFSHIERLVKQLKEKPFSSGKVMLIEDDPVYAEKLVHTVEELGLEVERFSSGEDALKAYISSRYVLVIADLILEGKMGGIHLISSLKIDEGTFVPIIAISGNSDPTRRVELFRAGADEFYTKPIDVDELQVKITRLAQQKQLFDKVQEQRAIMQKMAMTDQLTGLFNRHYLVEVAPQRIAEAQRHKQKLSLVIIDLDKFKSLNDTYGHKFGDKVLRVVSEVLLESCRMEDVPVRFGGEELILLLPHCNGASGFEKADEIRVKIENLKPDDITVTASFGVAELPDDPKIDLDKLIAIADKVLYRAKEEGRNRVILAD